MKITSKTLFDELELHQEKPYQKEYVEQYAHHSSLAPVG